MTEHCSVRSFTSTGREGALCRSLSLVEKEGGKGERKKRARERDDKACTKPESDEKTSFVVHSYQKCFLIIKTFQVNTFE